MIGLSEEIRPPAPATRTWSFKIRSEAYPWLEKAAREVNTVWNYVNELSYRAKRNYTGTSKRLIKGRFAKAVLDCAWASFKRHLKYKGTAAGRVVEEVDERDTSRACSRCGALTGPTGVNGLRVRVWICGSCGEVRDRDINAAENIRLAGRWSPSVRGNERHFGQPPPSRAQRPRQAGMALAEGAS